MLAASGISASFGTLLVLQGVDPSVRENELTGVISPNGTGKTTFFSVLPGNR